MYARRVDGSAQKACGEAGAVVVYLVRDAVSSRSRARGGDNLGCDVLLGGGRDSAGE